ncbi:MAG: hypothetical protein M3220_10610, partial [Chloroflexota bacterium]|nr:hypothetical protein [Chloroflexota bacterium]
WTRVLFYWHQVQPKGPDDWNPFFLPDRVVTREVAMGRELVGIIAGTAPWASESGTRHAVPSGLYLPYDHPDNLWGQFMYLMAQRYAGQIDHWTIWNEPDVWDEGYEGKSWNGSVEEYVQLLKIAYQAAKAANPAAVIQLAATTYWWDAQYGREPYFTRLLRTIHSDPNAAANDYFFDVATAHVYFKPEQVYDLTHFFRQQLDVHGFANKPLWINETNAPPSSDPHHPAPELRFSVTLEEQSNFLVQAWAAGLAAGAERIAYYKLRDEPWLPEGVEPYGMQRKDDSLRPVFWTYRALVTYLGGYEGAHLIREGNIWRVMVPRGSYGTTTVVWNMGEVAETVQVPATSEHALLVGPFGPLERIVPQEGSYPLLLPASSSGQIGGTPYMVVEGPGAEIWLDGPDGMEVAQRIVEEEEAPMIRATVSVVTAVSTPTSVLSPTLTPAPTSVPPTATSTPQTIGAVPTVSTMPPSHSSLALRSSRGLPVIWVLGSTFMLAFGSCWLLWNRYV